MFPNYPVLRVLETQLTFMAVGEPDYVFHRHDWCQKNPIAKTINFCKINICEKDPEVPKKGV